VLAVVGYGGSAIAMSLFGVADGLSFKTLDDGAKDFISGAVSTSSPELLLDATPHSGPPFEILCNIGVPSRFSSERSPSPTGWRGRGSGVR
jgi:hypothetical protein